MKQVISYTRFSTLRQADGDSQDRQDEKAEEWCRQRGYVIDDSKRFEDLGFSGYSGANVQRGALHGLQKLVEQGEIGKDTIILVEAFDRFTRLSLQDAHALLHVFTQTGATLVTTRDAKEWDAEKLKDPMVFLDLTFKLYQGYAESERKSGLVASAFKSARESDSQEEFGSAPGWLTRETKDAPWEVVEELAESVRKVFRLAAEGWGSKLIAKRANQEEWPVPTRETKKKGGNWHGNLPGYLLRQRSVLGEHEQRERSYKEQKKDWRGRLLRVVRDYYPPILDEVLWYQARVSVESRMTEKRRDSNYYNIFSGLMFCGHCGAPIQRKIEYRGSNKGQLVCADKLSGITSCPPAGARLTDATLIQGIGIYGKNYLGLLGDQYPEQKEELAHAEMRLAQLKAVGRHQAKVLSDPDFDFEEFKDEVANTKKERKSVEKTIQKLKRALVVPAKSLLDEQFANDVLGDLYEPGEMAKGKRIELHNRLKQVIDVIWIWAYDVAIVKFKGREEAYVIPLPHKQLPSRANPSAKFHKPPKPRESVEQPFQLAAANGLLKVPVPRRNTRNALHKN